MRWWNWKNPYYSPVSVGEFWKKTSASFFQIYHTSYLQWRCHCPALNLPFGTSEVIEDVLRIPLELMTVTGYEKGIAGHEVVAIFDNIKVLKPTGNAQYHASNGTSLIVI